ncbi:MAG: lipase family protein [Formosimonas sp.]
MGSVTLRDYTMAQLSNLAYKDEGPLKKEGGLPQGWAHFDSRNTNSTTGFAAHAFFNESTKEIVIAFRGSEMDKSMIDWKKADLALAKDGDPDKLLKGTNFEKQIPNAKEMMAKAPNWDMQFTQGLDFAEDIIKKYGSNYRISVTGHSLGGSIAQVVAKMDNLSGVTFDPGGAKNLVESDEFKSWARAHGKPENGLGSNNSPTNYIVNDSVVSNYSGPHVGVTLPLSGIAHQGWKHNISDAWSRHSMPRILDEFKEAYEQHRPVNQIGAIETNDAKTFTASNNDSTRFATVQIPEYHATLIKDATTHIEGWAKENGLSMNKHFHQAAHSVACAMHEKGADRVEHFNAENGRLHAMQRNGEFMMKTCNIDSKVASNTPIEESLAKMAQIDQQRTIAQNNPSQDRNIDQDKKQSGPRMG